MTYQVLARKWRPQTFAEVVGQEHITRTLQNAILQNRVGHAYLFVGPRGIGKTTTARLFAKALNCRKGVVAEPCCECESCREIAAGASLDVIEIDGASHNRVEHIRDLRENVQYTPSRSRYKIYIIDEVHMLTTAAWNALLKTLEEPPPHVKFLFATTEPHKVLPTIVSRCQRFDLKRIAVPLIVERLRAIADGEGIRVEEGALAAIARAADGGMRDAQSILDQMIAFCGGLNEGECIREQDVIDVFGLASGAELRRLTAGLLTDDMNEVMAVVQGLADQGRDLERLYSDVIGFLRNVMLCAVCREPEKLLEVGESELADLVNIARAVDADIIQRLLQGLVTQEWSFRSALNKRVYLEAALARVMVEAHSVQLDDILAQLAAMATSGDIPRLAAPAPKTPPVIPPPPTPAPRIEAPPKPAQKTREPASAAPSPVIPVVDDTRPPPDPGAAAPEPVAATATPQPEPGPDSAAAEQTLRPEARQEPEEAPTTSPATPGPAPHPPAAEGQAPPPTHIGETAEPPQPANTSEPVAAWERLLAELEQRKEWRQWAPLVRKLIPVSVIDRVLELGYPADMAEQAVKMLQDPAVQKLLQQAFRSALGSEDADLTVKRWSAKLSEDDRAGSQRASAEVREQVAQKPFVKKVCELFDASVVEVRV